MKQKLHQLHLQLHELEKQYVLSLDQLEIYKNIKDEIKRTRQKIEFDIE